jgi:hypothetical protein
VAPAIFLTPQSQAPVVISSNKVLRKVLPYTPKKRGVIMLLKDQETTIFLHQTYISLKVPIKGAATVETPELSKTKRNEMDLYIGCYCMLVNISRKGETIYTQSLPMPPGRGQPGAMG